MFTRNHPLVVQLAVSCFERISEDDLVNCLKQGGVAADAASEISGLTAEMIAGTGIGISDTDPFAGLEEDEDQTEQNQLLVDQT